jgi:PTS system galactitol-specific IIC component
MNTFEELISFIFSFKAFVMLPIFMIILGAILGMKFSKILVSALKLGVGFAGIFLLFDFFVINIAPPVEMIISKRELNYPILDVGWPPLAGITWASSIAPLTIPMIICANLIMIAMNATRTIYIDIWNFWHFALLGALLQNTNHSFLLSMLATLLIGIYCIKLSDWTAPYVNRECGLEGITVSPVSVVGLLPYAVTVNILLDKIPWIKRLRFNANKTTTRLEIFGEPMIIGVLVGIFLGFLAEYDIKSLSELCINIAAVMFLLPHCGSLIGNGMEPFSKNLKVRITKIFPNKKDLVIAIDSAVLFQNKSVIVTGIILMPISIIIAFVLPGNKIIPLGDLPNLISVMAVIVIVCESNVFRGIILGIPIIIAYLLIATEFAPLFTNLSRQIGLDYTREFSGNISAFTDGGNPIRYWFYYIFDGNIIALSLIPIVLVLFFITWKKHKSLISGGNI